MRFASSFLFDFFVPAVLLSALLAAEAQVPTALEASGAIQPGDTIVSVNGIPLPGAGCYRKDAELLEAPGMFPMRLRIRRAGAAAEDADAGHPEGFADPARGGRGAQALEGSLSRLKQVGCCCLVHSGWRVVVVCVSGVSGFLFFKTLAIRRYACVLLFSKVGMLTWGSAMLTPAQLPLG